MIEEVLRILDELPNIYVVIVEIVGSICSIVAFALSIAGRVVPTIWGGVLNDSIYVAIVALLGTLATYGWENRRLRFYVDDGMKLTYNKVKVSVDLDRKVYNFSFEKAFKLLSNNNPKWYKAQFYCNRHLEDSKRTKKFYDEHPLKWENLKVYANMRYKRPKDLKYSEPQRLKVVPITKVSYYIPFQIHYEDMNGPGSAISLEKGTKVVLNYGYEVPCELWGSYLNRSLSFFGEKACVIFEHPEVVGEKKVAVSLHKLLAYDSSPRELKGCPVTNIEKHMVIHEIELPRRSCAKYRIWWDSETLLGIPNTKNVVDDSKMTDY